MQTEEGLVESEGGSMRLVKMMASEVDDQRCVSIFGSWQSFKMHL